MDSAILAANQAFYDAFSREDPVAMREIWARHTQVGCIHPGWGALLGRDRVMASWQAIMENGAPPIRCVAPRVVHVGDAALVICEEHLGDGRLIATNVFVHEDGHWRIVHHHAGPIAADDQDTASTPDPHGPN